MRKIFAAIVIYGVSSLFVSTSTSCSGSSTAAADSTAIADSLARARHITDSLRIDSLNQAYTDSLNRFTTSPDLTLLSLHGLVESVDYQRSCEWVGSPRMGTYEFDSAGRLMGDVVRHGDKIVAIGDRSYGWNGSRVSMTGTAEFGNNEQEYNRLNRTYLKHFYDSEGRLTESRVVNNMDEISIRYTYEVTDTDHYGNWLVRNVTRLETETSSGAELFREVIPEIREITYISSKM